VVVFRGWFPVLWKLTVGICVVLVVVVVFQRRFPVNSKLTVGIFVVLVVAVFIDGVGAGVVLDCKALFVLNGIHTDVLCPRLRLHHGLKFQNPKTMAPNA
jgi:hypothetical protein